MADLAVPDALLTADEVAGILRLSRTQVYAIKRQIGFVRLGRVVRFRRASLDRYIGQNETTAGNAIRGIRLR